MVRDSVRRESVVSAVPGHEGDALTCDFADDQRVARPPERSLDLELVERVQELVEAGSADDADLCQLAHAANVPAGM